MIYDDLITVEFNPHARVQKHRFVLKYWKMGKATKQACIPTLDCPTDSILGRWGKEYSCKPLWYSVTAFMAKLYYDAQNYYRYYIYSKEGTNEYAVLLHNISFEVTSNLYDYILRHFKNRAKGKLFIGGLHNLDLYYDFYSDLMATSKQYFEAYHKNPTTENSIRKDVFWNTIYLIKQIRINDAKFLLTFRDLNVKDWENEEHFISPVQPNSIQ